MVSKPIYCFETKKKFDSVTLAAKSIGFEGKHFHRALDNPNRTINGLHWCTDLSIFEGKTLSDSNKKVIYCYETRQSFTGRKEAAKSIGCVTINTIILDNPNKTAGGYHWCTSLDVFDGVDFKSLNKNKNKDEEKIRVNKVSIWCFELNKLFSSISSASEYMDCSHATIARAINKHDKTAKGYHWCTDLSVFENIEVTPGRGKPIWCYELGKRFTSAKTAGVEFKINHKRIYAVINKSNRTAGGYHFCTDLSIFDGVKLTSGKENWTRSIYCYETTTKYESVLDACRYLGMTNTAINPAIDNPNKTAGGYHWCTSLDVFDGVELIYPDRGVSGKEKEVLDFIKSLTGNVEENTKKIIPPFELDIYIPDFSLAIEYNGDYWHSEEYKPKDYHINKTNMCKARGIQLIQIFEHQWLEKSEIFKSVIANKLGFSDKIYARKCKVVELKDCKEFLETNHLQGNCPSSIKLGLTYNDELVSLMTFGKPRFNKSYEYELIRFCNKLNTSVVGGASKLLKYFETKYKPKSLVSYANLQWSDGGLYNQLGFTYSDTSTPNYWWIRNNKLLNRYQCQKHKLKDLLGDKFNPDLSEKDNMENNGYSRLFDCGNIIFTKEYK